MATVTLKDVRKRYGATDVIHGISVDVEDGEFIVIVGPSGCGKSTLLRMVAGLETITDGEVLIGGTVVNDKEPMDRDIAMVFQNYALYPHMSVHQNMAYSLKIAKLPVAEIDRKVAEAAKLLQLEPYLDRKPKQLSGGQRQRVAMGRAIVRNPSAFLFDEPLSNLDAKLRVQMRLEIRQLQRKLGTTSLYVTHDQVEAMTLADRLIVMNAGVAEQIDTPMNVYSNPATTFVGGFIGSPAMNFLNGTLSEDGSTVSLESGGTIRVPDQWRGTGHGDPVTVGLRPEHLEAASTDAGDLSMRVTAVETLGADTLAHGTFGNTTETLADFSVRLPGGTPVNEGDHIPLAVSDSALHLFDQGTGKRL